MLQRSGLRPPGEAPSIQPEGVAVSKPAKRQTLTDIFMVTRDPRLTANELRVWLLYRSYDSKGAGAYPSDETLADHMDKGLRSVQAARAGLIQNGFLIQKLRGPERARYWAVIPDEAPQETAKQSLAEDCETNDEGSQVVSQVVSQNPAPHSTGEYGGVPVFNEKNSLNTTGMFSTGEGKETVVDDPTSDEIPNIQHLGFSSLLALAKRECHLGLETDDFANSRSILRRWLRQGRDTQNISAAIIGSRKMVDGGQVSWIEPKRPFSLRALNGQHFVTPDGERDLYTLAQDAFRKPDPNKAEHTGGNIRVKLLS